MLVDADHLEELGNGFGRIQGLADPDDSRRELDAVALVKGHGQAARRVNDDFLIFSTAPCPHASAPWGSADKGWPSRCSADCALTTQAGFRGGLVDGFALLG